MKPLSSQIAKKRAALGLSLRDVGEKANVSYQAVLKVERGLGRLETAARIAHALGISKRAIQSAATSDALFRVRRVAV